ncbi:hypothetical protein HZH68_009707 [Vespula germanica]|uniref:Uncharacterized protein n=1 Tax=Vespula germanica TaxID=30212 RepID=A0A834N472_VESGE|nr:hypothetical protein HZH68_009707 [Vespula germanica]
MRFVVAKTPPQQNSRERVQHIRVGSVLASTLAFKTFGLFRMAASQRRDLPPLEEGWLSHQNRTLLVFPTSTEYLPEGSTVSLCGIFVTPCYRFRLSNSLGGFERRKCFSRNLQWATGKG